MVRQGTRDAGTAPGVHDASSGLPWLRVADALAVVAVLLGGLAFLLRTLGPRRPFGGGRSRALRVIESLPLGPDAVLHLVRVSDRRFAIGACRGGLIVVCELPGDAEKRP